MPLNPEQLLKAVKLDGKTFETEEEFVAEFSKQYAPVDAPISEEKKLKSLAWSMRLTKRNRFRTH